MSYAINLSDDEAKLQLHYFFIFLLYSGITAQNGGMLKNVLCFPSTQ